MNRVQPSFGDPVPDRFGAEAERKKLTPRDEAVLLRRQPPSVDSLRGHSH